MEKPTVFNYADYVKLKELYEDALEVNDVLKAEVAEMQHLIRELKKSLEKMQIKCLMMEDELESCRKK